ncbi:glycosyltransferase family 2 protein [Azotobacter chroococcum]|uniref:Glycosyltransferase family 2 protein n=1 Tax=Azotobacter chroococcum TaxID=353 RepID=A0AAQ0BX48_9GAMM|nr:glycosyltransferase family 2 protein [Azotobacter chroococcum]QQE87163.1 glycosyltransferase family 2 protein [Azotobacter chroococcum]
MKISIAMATYNGSRYLPEQLDSFLRQTRQPDELVVCDDCSQDGTLDILRRFQQQAPFPVHIYQNERNLGFVRNFEKALSLCSGDILFLSDQDDVWFENRLAIIEQEFSAHPKKMVVLNDLEITTENLQPTGCRKLKNIHDLGFRSTYLITGCCTAIRREWRDIALPIPEVIGHHHIPHDMWINKLADLLGTRLIIERPLQFYRRHDNNTSSSPSNNISKTSKLKILISYGLKDAREGWMAKIAHTNLYLDRLEKSRSQIQSLGASERLDKAVIDLRNRLSALEHRLKIAAYPRWRRPPELLRFWLSGGYQNFAGWKSALKDMVRP